MCYCSLTAAIVDLIEATPFRIICTFQHRFLIGWLTHFADKKPVHKAVLTPEGKRFAGRVPHVMGKMNDTQW